MRVLVTGGLGLLGRAVSVYLKETGWEVKCIDIVLPSDSVDVGYSLCDITDFDTLVEQMRGCDTVVHLAALRNPFYAPAPELMRVNTLGTFHIFEAASVLGIRRIVQASSINAIGCAWNLGDFSPQYFPIDENHPSMTTDPYSFSKHMIEEIGGYYWRHNSITSVALRFPWIYKSDYPTNTQFQDQYNAMHTFLDELLSQSETERANQLAEIKKRVLAYRQQRPLEYPEKHPRPPELGGINSLLWKAYAFDRFNLWASLDIRDATQAIEKSLTRRFEGSHVLFVNDANNSLNYDTRTLTRLFFPDVHTWTKPVHASESLISNDLAGELLGYVPRYSLSGDRND